MGSFSWLKADTLTKVANVVCDAPFKFLIPAEFGGGFIKDKYQDYGYLGTKDNGEAKYDMYELLAFWNADKKLLGKLNWQGKEDGAPPPMMKELDMYTDDNRSIGIQIGCYDNQIDDLKYPLKLVSASYKGTYEDCEGRSYGDPNQGWSKIYRSFKSEANIRDIWKREYWDNDGELFRDLSREDDGTPIEDISRYEIVFDKGGQRYYCFIDAISIEEALGIFFKNHDTVTYKDIIDHIEI